jgi:hypothetical protein
VTQLTKLTDLFDADQRALATRALDYYDGHSRKHLEAFLRVQRKNALKKGLTPRTRNIVKMVADKSGLLFSGRAPLVQVWRGGAEDVNASAEVLDVLASADWVEYFTNLDVVVRLLKTAYVLVQVDPETGAWMLETLDRHNAAIVLDDFRRPALLVYATGATADGATYRVWTRADVRDVVVDPHGNETVVATRENPLGLIPIAGFHDTSVPREGAWNPIPEDLIEINDIYNLHVTDAEYASMWAKQPTLFTNAVIQGGTGGQMEACEVFGQPLPRWMPSNDPGFVGGPGTVVAVDVPSGGSVFLEYRAPVVALQPLDEMVNRWVADYAADWSVNISAAGDGSATSGFQLVVQEMPALDLRRHRQRMFEAGFKRLYKVMAAVGATIGAPLPPDGELYVTFPPPDLPVDPAAVEDVWAARIAGGRASRVDYFREVQGMTQEEAVAKAAEVAAQNAADAQVAADAKRARQAAALDAGAEPVVVRGAV